MKIDWLVSYPRAGRKLWRRLCGNGPLKLAVDDPRHLEYVRIMARVKAGVLAAIEHRNKR